jgi:hypothetical protein
MVGKEDTLLVGLGSMVILTLCGYCHNELGFSPDENKYMYTWCNALGNLRKSRRNRNAQC